MPIFSFQSRLRGSNAVGSVTIVIFGNHWIPSLHLRRGTTRGLHHSKGINTSIITRTLHYPEDIATGIQLYNDIIKCNFF